MNESSMGGVLGVVFFASIAIVVGEHNQAFAILAGITAALFAFHTIADYRATKEEQPEPASQQLTE